MSLLTSAAESPRPPWWRPALAGLAVAAALTAVVCSAGLFPYLSSNSDEGAYLAQAEALASGHLATAAPAQHPESELPWFAILHKGHYVYKYTPLHAGVLAAAIVATGSPLPALALIAAADAVLLALLARALGASHRGAVWAAVLLVASPAWFIQSGTYLPYLSDLALLLAAALAATRGVHAARRSPWPWLLTGFFFGWAFFARQYDALLFAVPVLSVAGVTIWRNDRQRLIPSALLVVAGALPAAIALLAYDARVTGSPWRLPFQLLDHHDALGFGRRRVLPTDPLVDYTPFVAAKSLFRWLILVVGASAGGLPLVGYVVVRLVRDRTLPGRNALLAIMVVWPLGYFFFWGIYSTAFLWDGAIVLGPYYFMPVVAALAIGGGVLADRLAQERPRAFRGALAIVVALTLFTGVVLGAPNVSRTDRRATVADAVNGAMPTGPSLLLLPPERGPVLQHPFSWLRNPPDRGGTRRFALANPATEIDVIAANPGRAVYQLSLPGDGFRDVGGAGPKPVVLPERVVRGHRLVLQVRPPPSFDPAAQVLSVGFFPYVSRVVPGSGASDALGLTISKDRLLLTRSDDSVVDSIRQPVTATVLLVQIAETDAAGVVRIDKVGLPLRVEGGQITVVAPGQVILNQLRGLLELSVR